MRTPLFHFRQFLLRKIHNFSAVIIVIIFGITSTTGLIFASSTSNFSFTVNAGTLAVDIVDASYVSVSSPAVVLSAVTFSFACQTGGSASTGTLGEATQQIYVKNPDAADNGWSVTLAATSGATSFYDSAGTDVDFNDSASSGCGDGGDADSLKGQLTVNPSAGTLAVGACSSCTTTSVTKGSSSAFVQGTTDTITILTGATGSDDIGDWKLTGVTLSQTIPAELPANNDYDINMTLSIAAS